jgi:hypothetical protein
MSPDGRQNLVRERRWQAYLTTARLVLGRAIRGVLQCSAVQQHCVSQRTRNLACEDLSAHAITVRLRLA